jgi:hypothetical protein
MVSAIYDETDYLEAFYCLWGRGNFYEILKQYTYLITGLTIKILVFGLLKNAKSY